METLSNAFVLGYHGCHKSVAENVLAGNEHLRPSENAHDWLGTGIYFWESDPLRGLEWAANKHGTENASVIGAAIHLGRSLNLMSRYGCQAVAQAYEMLRTLFADAGAPLPANGSAGMKRDLDCAVIQHLHTMRKTKEPSKNNLNTSG